MVTDLANRCAQYNTRCTNKLELEKTSMDNSSDVWERGAELLRGADGSCGGYHSCFMGRRGVAFVRISEEKVLVCPGQYGRWSSPLRKPPLEGRDNGPVINGP